MEARDHWKTVFSSDRATYLFPKEPTKIVLPAKDGISLLGDFYTYKKGQEDWDIDTFPFDLEGDLVHIERKRSGLLCAERDPLPLFVDRENQMSREDMKANYYWGKVQELDRGSAGYKAERLLREFLTVEEQRSLDDYGYFIHRFGQWGRFRDGRWHADVYGMKSYLSVYFGLRPWVTVAILGRDQMHMCWHPDEPIPGADILLAHFLAIDNNPVQYIRQANYKVIANGG